MIQYRDEYIDNSVDWIGFSHWINYISKKLPELGYTPIVPNEVNVFNVFGGYILKKEEQLEEFKSLVGERLLKKAFDRNTKIEDKLYG